MTLKKKYSKFVAATTLFCAALSSNAFVFPHPSFIPSDYRANLQQTSATPRLTPSKTALSVSIGLGPQQQKDDDNPEATIVTKEVQYEIPNHEEYRLSRRSKLDQACDEWYAALLGTTEDSHSSVMGPLADQLRTKLMTPVLLVNDIELPRDHEDWTPYVTTKLPWTPLVPAYGLETFSLPVPRRNAETWRHFDVAGMVGQDYSLKVPHRREEDWSPEKTQLIQEGIKEKGVWLDDDACEGRLVYVNGQFVPQLSKTVDGFVQNLNSFEGTSPEFQSYLSRLTDGFTDDLVVPAANGGKVLTSFEKLSGPNHNMGPATSQFAINTQQGTACFAALNTIHTQGIALVHGPASKNTEEEKISRPVLIINAVTPSGGAAGDADGTRGVAIHPRTLVVAEEGARLSVVQSCIDLDDNTAARPKLYNGYTQFFIKANANVTHSYMEESGGLVTAGTELSDQQAEVIAGDKKLPRQVEAERPELKDTHLEAIDVHLIGEEAGHEGTIMSIGGSGRVRIALSATLLKSGTSALINGFALSGGLQRTDMKTNIHHIAQGTNSRQIQKNMIGGRATGSFRGRIRVEQSAQQTDSEQLARTVLLSDKSRAWAVPSLEIIADDVKCSHGLTVSDLSEEELFYLRSRGLGRSTARNLLMYAFAGDISTRVDPAMLGTVDSEAGLIKRVIARLENLVPQGERAIKGEFQSI